MNDTKIPPSYCVSDIARIEFSVSRDTQYVRRMMKLLLVAALLSGCVYSPDKTFIPAAYYYLNPSKNLSETGRVAIVDLANESSYPEISADITNFLYQALQKKQIFGLTVVRQNDPAWRSLQLELESMYTLKQLSSIRSKLKCNAVLTGTVTQYQPYPNIVVGLRLKLVDLRDGELLWALEQIWDSADKETERRIKKYFNSQMRSGFAPLRENLVAASPLEFIRFVVYEVGETIRGEE